MGFYSSIFILFIAVTGLVWSFDWWTNGIYILLGSDPKTVFKENKIEYETDSIETPNEAIMNLVFRDVISQRKNWKYASISIPSLQEENSLYNVYLPFDGFSGWDLWNSYAYDSRSGKMRWKLTQERKSIGEKWRNSNYAWHVGSIFGWPSKAIASIVCYLCFFTCNRIFNLEGEKK